MRARSLLRFDCGAVQEKQNVKTIASESCHGLSGREDCLSIQRKTADLRPNVRHTRNVSPQSLISRGKAANPIDIGSFGADAVTFDTEVPADAIEEFGWRGAGQGRRIFRDAKRILRLGNDGQDGRGKLPPVVGSVFSIKAARWCDGIRGAELGARSKERTARGAGLSA